MNTAVYLRRIAYHGPTEPTAETLRALHRVHLLTVPFENPDIHLGNPISLDEEALFDKIVARRRGVLDDIYYISRGYASVPFYIGFIVVHLVIIGTGVMFVRRASAAEATS